MFWLRIGILTGMCMMFTAGFAQAGNTNYGNFWNFWNNGNFGNWGSYGNGYVRTVPIPATEVLSGLGFAALAWIGPKLRKRGWFPGSRM
ncbi:MAG: hypothetical protein GDA65_20070 [Nitrospira sp. CR1.1]|jgi:hypothetical protein|nr:hypothetical protein [Nitrospira sp. CR1.1]